MKEWTLRISSEAEGCINEQVDWYMADDRHGGEELGLKWAEKLEVALEAMRLQRERYGFAPENGRWMEAIEIRQMRFKPWSTPSAWRILFSLDSERRQVVVLQVRHERRPRLFEADG